MSIYNKPVESQALNLIARLGFLDLEKHRLIIGGSEAFENRKAIGILLEKELIEQVYKNPKIISGREEYRITGKGKEKLYKPLCENIKRLLDL